MASIKILIPIGDGEKKNSIFGKKKIAEFPKYQNLKDEILKNLEKDDQNTFITSNDNFILRFIKEKNSKAYFPEELNECIFNNPTFDYLKEKIDLRGIKDATYKFQIEKVGNEMPIWRKIDFKKILNKALEEKWNPINEEIKREVDINELEKSQVKYSEMKADLAEKEKKINKKHTNIICNNCFKNDIKGKRFICAECNNYNLCQDCEKIFYKRQIHNRKHVLIQVNVPLDGDDKNVLKYNNIISKNNLEIKLSASDLDDSLTFPVNFEFLNNGENNLKDCYILPIRYGEDYLSCASINKFNEDIEMNYSGKFGLMIKIPNLNKKYYEGYFRMFTPCGLPFGQVIFIKLFLDD